MADDLASRLGLDGPAIDRASGSRLNQFLRGLKVIDFSGFLPGPLASLLLADMGAEILKIEPPAGDEMQRMGPRGAQGEPLFYNAVNAGKLVRNIDLKQPEGLLEAKRFVAEADVLIEGFRPGVMARLGLGYEDARTANAGVIYCSLNGYGAEGPLAQAAGHDGNYLALAGILHRNGDARPMFFDPPVADTTGSLFATIAILGALEERRRTGRGCRIDLALADVMMPMQLFQIAAFGADGVAPEPCSTYLNGGAAYYQVYATRDGRHVMLGAIEPKFWRAFCLAAERPDWVERQQEPMPQRTLIGEVAAYLAGLSFEVCLDRFGLADCCFSAVLNLGEAIGSPHHEARGLVRRSEDPALQALFPVLIDGVAPATRRPLRRSESASETRSSTSTADQTAPTV
jgi:crotonobetainyl-CoA:carnitine CoA-transferase CaiB-like acyl-CoA transferase